MASTAPDLPGSGAEGVHLLPVRLPQPVVDRRAKEEDAAVRK